MWTTAGGEPGTSLAVTAWAAEPTCLLTGHQWLQWASVVASAEELLMSPKPHIT